MNFCFQTRSNSRSGLIDMNHHFTRPDEITRPTQVLVNLDAIAHNYRQFCAHAQSASVMPVIKANAYGHGLVEVAQYLETMRPPYFGVATFEEAICLRDADIRTPILVFGGMYDEQIPEYIKRGLTLTASSISKLNAIDKAGRELGIRPEVHLKFDTGMERVGVHHYNASYLITAALSCTSVDVRGIYTHFATADEADEGYALLQLERFNGICELARSRFDHPLICHTANSAATLKIQQSHLDMVRVGIALYGVVPNPAIAHTLNLRPALSWTSKVVYFKVVRAGDPVSYGRAWRPNTETRLVTVPVGYADGYSRQLSNNALVRINGKEYPVVGKVCMDQFMVDIGEDSAFNGDEVTLIGDGIDAHRLADWQSTIAYEVLTTIGARVPRAYVFDDEPENSQITTQGLKP